MQSYLNRLLKRGIHGKIYYSKIDYHFKLQNEIHHESQKYTSTCK